ncbi:MAG: hypothetical protein PHV63_01130 [Candidatus Daviesbacteria bacterium]|nr:hypothetical protein [Candidatus Daviesbacteria bacterium]
MPKGKKVTSLKIAKIASKLLRKSKVKKVRKVAASDLSQREKSRKKK